MDELPKYTPRVRGGIGVEPEYRNRRVGDGAGFARGGRCIRDSAIECAYLCALDVRRAFYLRQGWLPIMEKVGEHGMTVFIRDRPA